MKITQVRNATIIVEYAGVKFLIDPWLAPKDYMPGFDAAINSDVRQPRVDLPFEINKIVDVDCVILTHFHPDHWDEFAEKAIRKDMKIFVQSEDDKNYLCSKGFNNLEILSAKGLEYKGVMLYKTGCQHGKRSIVEPLCKQINMPYDSMGVVFKANSEKTLYLAGDTIYCEEVGEAISKYRPEIIIVNACGATLLNGERIIMTQEDILEIIKQIPDAIIIASHMDTVSHLTITREDLRVFKEKSHLNRFFIPDDGEVIVLN